MSERKVYEVERRAIVCMVTHINVVATSPEQAIERARNQSASPGGYGYDGVASTLESGPWQASEITDPVRVRMWLEHHDVDSDEEFSDALMHASRCHPDYEYATTTNARKDGTSPMPDGLGWEPNRNVTGDGRNWERFEYHEENYWMR